MLTFMFRSPYSFHIHREFTCLQSRTAPHASRSRSTLHSDSYFGSSCSPPCQVIFNLQPMPLLPKTGLLRGYYSYDPVKEAGDDESQPLGGEAALQNPRPKRSQTLPWAVSTVFFALLSSLLFLRQEIRGSLGTYEKGFTTDFGMFPKSNIQDTGACVFFPS
jgi:hypothetical protein